MLTIFSVPKPFRGHIGDIQRNAVASWRALDPELQIVLVGDEDGVEEAAREAGVEHVSAVARNERGTPRLDGAFERVAGVARHPLWCLVNSDIILLDDFLPTVARVRDGFARFLVVGESRDLEVGPGAVFADRLARLELRARALAEGRLRGYAALDYFVFPRGHFDPLPPFLIGRACFDNWLVWRARERGAVVDATRTIVSVHQSHDYSHVAGGFQEAYYGEEAKHNERLAGGRSRIYSLHDATHRSSRDGRIVRYWGSTFRARENARKVRVRLDLRVARYREARRPGRPLRVTAVFPEPTPYRNPLLDAVGRVEGLDLSVLYAARSVAGRTWSFEPPEHVHWVMRSVRVPGARRLLRHDYPVNYAIWRALLRLRPECVVVSGWSTFAAQAAVAWCRFRRIPYLLLVESHDRDPRRGWRRAVKSAVVPAIVRGASGVLVAGSLARESMLDRGADPSRIRVFANTVDVGSFVERSRRLAADRPRLRRRLGLAADQVAVLSVARLAPEKGLSTLVRAAAETDDPRVVVVVAGGGPEAGAIQDLARDLGVRLVLLGEIPWSELVDVYIAADVFALLSESEPWGVVVNEAAACGLPFVLSDAVGAAHDLLVDGQNGRLVSAGDSSAAAAALAELAADSARRTAWGEASRALVASWGYDASVEGLLELVQLAVGRPLPASRESASSRSAATADARG